MIFDRMMDDFLDAIQEEDMGYERIKSNETYSVHGAVVVTETDKALLCLLDEDEVWIPKSQIARTSEVQMFGDEGELIVTEWFAKQKEWVDED